MSATRQQRKTTMATIGTFTAAQNGYGGSVKTRSLFRPKRTDKAPDYRTIDGNIDYA